MNKYIYIALSVFVVLWLSFVFLGRRFPIHRSDLSVGEHRIYYRETSRLIQCDVAYFEVIVYDDGTNEFVYELIPIGNGSCLSELYVWHERQSYTLGDAIALDIVSLEDFLDSDVAIERPITIE